MLFYPQLNTGAVSQYPLAKRRLAGNVINETADGSQVKYAVPELDRLSWRLAYRGLQSDEAERISALFHATEGRLGTFTFHDPAGNLLRWSEKLDEAVWERNTLVNVTGGTEDPMGSTRGWTLHNGGAAPLAVTQRIAGVAWHTYALSLWVRGEAEETVTLMLRTADASLSQARGIGTAWKRIVLADGLPSGEPWIEFGVELAAGQSVDVFGMQVESQAAPSLYRKTASRSGVYTAARFAHDVLRMVADGPNNHACELVVEAPLA